MLKKIFLVSSLLITSMTAQAGLIQYGDYKRDSASNTVVGNGLEWLKWDVTKGMSANSALDVYSLDGWRLASNDEMASLFKGFTFGKTDWDNREIGLQSFSLPWNAEELTSANYYFINLFGATAVTSCKTAEQRNCAAASEPYVAAQAIYGSDTNNNARYKLAQVVDDYTTISIEGLVVLNGSRAALSSDLYNASGVNTNAGIALVRTPSTTPSVVPTPASISLLALGLAALGYRRRQVSRR